MDIGMLWFDDSSRTMDEKIRRAVDFYAEKYGRRPTVCMVHPTTAEAEGVTEGIQVRPARSILPHHFLVGIEDEKSNGNGAAAKQLKLELNDGATQGETAPPKRRRSALPALDGQAA